jgi:hypothetical protein
MPILAAPSAPRECGYRTNLSPQNDIFECHDTFALIDKVPAQIRSEDRAAESGAAKNSFRLFLRRLWVWVGGERKICLQWLCE